MSRRPKDNRPLIERLLEKLIKDPITQCWNWTGPTSKGYGQFQTEKGRTYVHRFSYEYYKGPIPHGLLVCHECDNPVCVNPNHLWLGSNKDNQDDMIKKGRKKTARGIENGSVRHPEKLPHGKNHWRTKNPEKVQKGDTHWTKRYPERLKPRLLTLTQVNEIRDLYNQGKCSKKNLAIKFCVGGATINQIIENSEWKTNSCCSLISENV